MQNNQYDAIWQTIWNKVRTYENYDASQVDAFFSRLQLQAFSQGYVMLTADTSFIKTWIKGHYLNVIQKALTEIYGEPFTIEIEVDENSSTSIPSSLDVSRETSHSALSQEKVSEIPNTNTVGNRTNEIPPVPENINQEIQPVINTPSLPNSTLSEFSFDNFVVGTSNQLAYSMAVAVAESPGQPDLNPLFIYGRSGLGKTHLLRAIQNYVDKNFAHMKTLYIDTMELIDDYTNTAISRKNSSFEEFKQRYKSVDMLLIDDVQGLQRGTETLNMLFQILKHLLDSGKQVVLSADRAPKNIDIDERYQSRFNQGGTCDIQPPEFETKLGIIRNYITKCLASSEAHFFISDEIQGYIAQNSSSNIRELKSAVNKIIFAINGKGGGDITITEVQDLLVDHFSGGAMHHPTVKGIQKAVEEYYNISHAELVGKKRSANITKARQIAIYLCYELVDITGSAIGEEFNRDHSTVIYSRKLIEDKLKESRDYREMIETIRQMILEG